MTGEETQELLEVAAIGLERVRRQPALALEMTSPIRARPGEGPARR